MGEFLGVVVSVFILVKNVLCLATGLSSAALNLFLQKIQDYSMHFIIIIVLILIIRKKLVI